ncbi:hypothetical protein C7S18_15320 [Ahniella affigens]|uniref:Uncharacterized protein n=1 Tax=Ahniella affigens TaxID=2021234 RepID=A0A2P1PUH8_9GAMM|nr:hypothetical protein [Ahniella affigens]AVP98472.1 hypothetical protein C7S18_15320 [Ahniella affigens]
MGEQSAAKASANPFWDCAQFLTRHHATQPYPGWHLFEAPCHLSRLGKRGDEFEGDLLAVHEDLRVLVLREREPGVLSIELLRRNSEDVLMRFQSVLELERFLCQR